MSFTFELKGVPVQFTNAIRRILLNETPTVELADVQILGPAPAPLALVRGRYR